mmetsp:Transcript_20176/g.56230  ORF Transcript_20176/g.56230 Transcript_20176/m.56230 type:complete len:115 (+) Transcript_20176:110-454(+)
MFSLRPVASVAALVRPRRLVLPMLQLPAARSFCAPAVVEKKAEAPKAAPKKSSGGFGSRVKSFAVGFALASAASGYALFFKVQLASEELAAMVREAAARQAQIERRLAALEGKK